MLFRSYEILKLSGRSENPIINLLSKPGLAIQKLTTKEPDDSMIVVAIQAVEAVFDWREFEKENFGLQFAQDVPLAAESGKNDLYSEQQQF